jgi:hypothetical protein
MVKPVNPSNPTGGDGNEKYNPNQKRGPSDYDRTVEKLDKEKAAEKARAELNKMAEETRAKKDAERPRTYTERLQDMGRLPKPTGGGGGGGGDFSGMKGLDKPFKAGGKVSSASKRADGCAIRGKTRA